MDSADPELGQDFEPAGDLFRRTVCDQLAFWQVIDTGAKQGFQIKKSQTWRSGPGGWVWKRSFHTQPPVNVKKPVFKKSSLLVVKLSVFWSWLVPFLIITTPIYTKRLTYSWIFAGTIYKAALLFSFFYSDKDFSWLFPPLFNSFRPHFPFPSFLF